MKDSEINKIIAAISAYSLVVASLYLWGYWGSFGLNFLEFIGFGDMLRFAILPLLISMAGVMFGFAYSQILHGDMFPVGGGADTTIGRFAQTYWRVLIVLNLLAVYLVAQFAPEETRWYIVASLLIPLSAPLTHLDYLHSLIPNPQVRWNLVVLPVFFAGMAFAQGRLAAHSILKGEGNLFVDTVESGMPASFSKERLLSYVGHLADFFVFYQASSSRLYIVNAGKVSNLVLLHNVGAVDNPH